MTNDMDLSAGVYPPELDAELDRFLDSTAGVEHIFTSDTEHMREETRLFWAWLKAYLPAESYHQARAQSAVFMQQLHAVAWQEFTDDVHQIRLDHLLLESTPHRRPLPVLLTVTPPHTKDAVRCLNLKRMD